MNNIRLSIDGLEQNETQERVRDQIEGIVGVSKVETSAGQTYVDFTYDEEQTSANEINNHLQNNGYKITDFKEE